MASSPHVILIVLLPETGAFNASFVLAKALTARGHRVAYLGPEDYRDHVVAQDMEYVSVKVPDQPADDRKRRLFGEFRKRRVQRKSAYSGFIQLLAAAEAEIQELSPSVILLDPLMWRYSPPLLACGVPIIGLNTTLAWRFDTDRAPVFSRLIPGPRSGNRQRLSNIRAWCPIVLKELRSRWQEDAARLCLLGPRKANRHRARSLIKARGGRLALGEYGARLILPELVMAPAEFDFPTSRGADRVYIGACVDLERKDGNFDWSALSEELPLLYCSLGTYSKAYPDAKRLFTAVIDAFRERADWQVLIQVGDAAVPEDFGEIPSHIMIAKFVPQISALKRAKLFITHGGISSVREAALLGVPMIVFPCWLDQPGNAARVEYHGLGLRSEISTVTPAAIAGLVEVARDSAILSRVEAMSAVFRGQMTGEYAASWLEENAGMVPMREKETNAWKSGTGMEESRYHSVDATGDIEARGE